MAWEMGTLHRAAVTDTALKLPDDIFSNELGVQIGLLDFLEPRP